jgi:hypothetical protein
MKFLHFVLLSAACLLAGCGPQLSREELGEVIFNVPSVPGSATPYPLPADEAQERPEASPPDKDDKSEAEK